MTNTVTVAGLLMMSGVCLYAAVHHLLVGLQRPRNLTHLLFSGMCLAVGVFGPTEVLGYRAQSVADYAVALKLGLACITAFGALYPWFIASFTGQRFNRWFVVWTVPFVVLFIVNLLQPYGAQFVESTRLERLPLPWGETIPRPIGVKSVGLPMAVALFMSNYVFGVFSLAKAWRRERSSVMAAMLIATLISMAGGVEGSL